MYNHSDAREHDPYQQALTAMMEAASLVLTLHTVATLNPQNIQNLVVEFITTLLDDIQLGNDPSRGRSTPPGLSVHLDILTAALRDPQAADYYRQVDQAVGDVEKALGKLRLKAAALDALDSSARSNLDRAISDAKGAFRQLAAAGSNAALLDEIGRMLRVIGGIRDELVSLGDMRADNLSPDRDSFKVPIEGREPYWRTSVADWTRDALSRSPYDDPRSGFDPLGG